jgi:hypothetical protein
MKNQKSLDLQGSSARPLLYLNGRLNLAHHVSVDKRERFFASATTLGTVSGF